MTASPSRVRAFLGLPALDDPAAMTQPRAIPWRAAPAAFAVALVVLAATGIAVQEVWNGRDNWQVNSPAIAGLTAILLLAPSSPTQPRARHAMTSAIVGLAVIGAAYVVAIARQDSGTGYGAAAFIITTIGALAGCAEFTFLTRAERWTIAPGRL